MQRYLLTMALLFGAGGAGTAETPNIVLILADDLGLGDLGCYNADSKIPTPNLDRLASEGMRFTDAHSPSAVCTPTRYGVLTGRYSWRGRLKKGVLQGYSPMLIEKGRMTSASLLKKHGYGTGCVGKWHLGLGNAKRTDYDKPLSPGPNSVGFDHFFGIPASLDMDPYLYVVNDKPEEKPTEMTKKSLHRRQNGGGFWRAGPIAPNFKHIDVLPRTTKEAVAFLERQNRERTGKPFFLYFPLSAPHTPWMPTKEYRNKSKAGYYGDFTVQVDATIGTIVEALDRLKLRENTLLIVTSDNGAHWPVADVEKFKHRANGNRRGQKADIWEGGHRVPFLVRWPGVVQPGSTCDSTICHVDLLATFADIVDEKLPKDAGEDSFSLVPLLKGEKAPQRAPVIHHSAQGVFAVRVGDWKLIEGLGSGGFTAPRKVQPKPDGPKGQLYNLAEDPREATNLYQKMPEKVEELQATLAKLRQQGRSR